MNIGQAPNAGPGRSLCPEGRAMSRPVDGLVRRACDGCKYQREDGACRKPGRAWRMSGKDRSCFVTPNSVNHTNSPPA